MDFGQIFDHRLGETKQISFSTKPIKSIKTRKPPNCLEINCITFIFHDSFELDYNKNIIEYFLLQKQQKSVSS